VERGDVWRNHDICSRLLHFCGKVHLHSSSGDGETGLVGASFQKETHMARDCILLRLVHFQAMGHNSNI
jgi:hypothetical protein